MYIGSVRFFKNLILLAVVILIAVPTVFAIRSRVALSRAEDQLSRMQEQLTQQEQPPSQPEQNFGQTGQSGFTQVQEPGETGGEEVSAQTAFSVETPAYQSLYPDFYAPQPLSAQTREEGVIYLTFDDGPTANTDKILNILAQENIKATFFINGRTDEASLQRMRNIVAQGHTLGMHSYTHEFDVIYNSVEDFLADQYQLFTLIRETTGVTPTVFRFPGGSVNSYNYGIYQELIAEMMRRGFVPFDWNVSAEDAVSGILPSDRIVSNVLLGATGKVRGVVLMHDGAAQATTADALPSIIMGLRGLGFRFEPITADTMPVLFHYPQ